MKLVLFDCDGTLVDSAGLIHEVMGRTFEAFDLPRPQAEATRGVIGLTLDTAIARLMEQSRIDSRIAAMTTHYKAIFTSVRSEGHLQEALFPGIADMVQSLAGRDGLLIGAVTGKSRRGLSHIAEAHGFDKLFFVSRTADDCPSKPHPAMVMECCAEAGVDPKNTIVIGDAIYDMQMAKAAGAGALGVSWGNASVPALIEAGADHIAHVPPDIIEWMEASHA